MNKITSTLLAILTLITMSTFAQIQNPTEYQDVYSVYITKDLKASKEFYMKWLDFEVGFEASWFVYLQSKGEHKITFALIDEKHPSTPPSYGSFNGRGSFLTLQVKDAAAVYDKFKKMKAPITYHLKREDWGQIKFGLTDPNGLYIDIVQQVDPAPGYWDQFKPK
ncbi:MAG TPA: VOC family protein [Chryseolinea sp.]|nr:VOC family protein [Chryseolinea sp.]